jgi:hydrogenase nickel incorporation protein HypA/HybF
MGVHEIGYCEGVLDAVLRRSGDRPVTRIGVRAGTLHRLVPDAFQQSFALVAAGTPAADAITEVIAVPATAVCTTCGNRFDTPDPGALCPSCGGFDVDLEGGDDLVLAWIEYADEASVPQSRPAPSREHATERIAEHTHERT